MRWASIICGITLLVAPAARATEPVAAKPQIPTGWSFAFPAGNPTSGKAVFLQMECYSCHRTRGLIEKPPEGAGGIGPDLTGYAGLPREYLAESIIKAHTVVAAPGYVDKDGQAGMGKYNHFMTIQELVDLVAFLHAGAAGESK
jgi:mono/diheme cytochrome c family protein